MAYKQGSGGVKDPCDNIAGDISIKLYLAS